MQFTGPDGLCIHYDIQGAPDGAPIVFSNSLGTDLRLWDAVVPLLPPGLRIVRYDTRGHGGTDCPPGPYAMGSLVRDAEALLDHLNIRDCVFVGLSLGGMVAQGLAIKRLDQIRALVLSNTGARIGFAPMWRDRAALVRRAGIEAITDAVIERWFSKTFRATPAVGFWRDMLTSQPAEGYAGCCEAIAGTDFYTPTSGLGLPTLGIASDRDIATPPDLVRETVDLIRGSKFELIRGAGHLPCVEKPDEYAALLTGFLTEIGHI